MIFFSTYANILIRNYPSMVSANLTNISRQDFYLCVSNNNKDIFRYPSLTLYANHVTLRKVSWVIFHFRPWQTAPQLFTFPIAAYTS
jgi:hypothetical protein